MKKLLLILFILFITAIAGAFFFAVPQGFHTIVHKLIIPEVKELQGRVNYEVITRDHHQSTFMYQNKKTGDDYKVEISTLTFFNPAEDYVSFTITNTRNIEEAYVFKLYFELPDGKLRLRIKSNDVQIKKDQFALDFKDINIYIGDFSLSDFNDAKESPEEIEKLIYNKSLTIEVDQLISEIKGDSAQIKELQYVFTNKMDDNKLSFEAFIKMKSLKGVINNKPVFFNDTNAGLSFSKLHADKAKELTSSVIEGDNPMLKNPMFLAMNAMNIISFPINLKFSSASKSDVGLVQLELDAKMQNKNFMNLGNFEVKVLSKNKKDYYIDFLSPLLINQFAKLEAENYSPNNPSLIVEFLTNELAKDPERLMSVLVDNQYLKKQGELYTFESKMQSAKITIEDKQMELNEFLDSPQEIIYMFFQDSEDSNINLLEQKLKDQGLEKIKDN